MEYGVLIIFYYGILHALGPDHLSAITLFSIGKKRKEALLLSLLFAIGHGMTLYILALFIAHFAKPELLVYGDTISSIVLLLMGLYLVYLAATNQIRIDTHTHHEQPHVEQHTHIYYKDAHLHDKGILFSLGLLMGVGGIRGMLVTLGAVSHHQVGLDMVVAFILGVSVVFLLFGYLIYLINTQWIRSSNILRVAVSLVGVLTIMLSSYKLLEEVYLV